MKGHITDNSGFAGNTISVATMQLYHCNESNHRRLDLTCRHYFVYANLRKTESIASNYNIDLYVLNDKIVSPFKTVRQMKSCC